VIDVEIPGRSALRLSHAILDLNGTLAFDGAVGEGVVERLLRLRERLDLVIASADTTGTLASWGERLGIRTRRAADGADKVRVLEELRGSGAKAVAAFGNGMNDVPVLRRADLAVVVLGREGAAGAALSAADLVCLGPEDALDLLLQPLRLASGLRG
jgi:soluble P-type ATPase